MTKREMPEEATMQAVPVKEHEWLQKLVGEWVYEGEATMEGGKPPMKFSGVEKVRSVGGLWYISEAEGPMPGGGTATMILTLGYDPQEKCYVGTWIGSMMTHLWVYEGNVDATGKVLTLDSTGPNMAVPGATAKFQDITEFKNNDHRVLTSRMLSDDGKWNTVLTAHYRRKKS